MKVARARTLEEYLEELEGKKSDKPEQVQEGMKIYVELWRKAVERGVVALSDDLGVALEEVEALGGLYKAAGE